MLMRNSFNVSLFIVLLVIFSFGWNFSLDRAIEFLIHGNDDALGILGFFFYGGQGGGGLMHLLRNFFDLFDRRFAVMADPQGALFAIFTPLGDQRMVEPTMGEFSWHELMTTSSNDGFAFYEALFGWKKTSAMDMGPQGVYQMFGLSSDVPLGGVYTIPEGMGAPPNWLPYIHVENADAAAARVTQLGGSIKNGPMEVPGGDRIAICADPQGCVFAVHSRAK